MQYVSKEVSEALVSQITKGFGIDVNIIFGDIDIVADTPIGGASWPFSMVNRYGLTRL
ncbi:NIL domain-containing protein [Bifidobacterium longum]|nr:NIL domain-containing protein [Bifidobacterium longum]MDB6594102.1 NIL domain-containing protein [Bifidobacterium longum]MDB6907864.1 NIL domain-containing protein [Bifidobacterium longum]MDB6911158.1 NIL domain-containing protein [Bifidobacterium longum]MDB6913382.1 NIL domain-containing protein [Bifidobacterium longum]